MKGIVYIALYVDDYLMMRNMTTIDDAIETMKNKRLMLKIVERLQDYLSCEMKFSKERKRA